MRILVCVKQVPDTTEVRFDEHHNLIREGIPMILNPDDATAVALALALCMSYAASVTVMTMGKPAAEPMLRDLLARGADRAILLTDRLFAGADTLATAHTLCVAIRQDEPYDLILCGSRAIDGETGQVGPMLAAMLDVPVIVNATAIAPQASGGFIVTQHADTEQVEWSAPSPLVVTVCENRALPLPLPSILGMRNARTAEIPHWDTATLNLLAEQCGLRGSPTRVVRATAQPVGIRACHMLTMDELMQEECLS